MAASNVKRWEDNDEIVCPDGTKIDMQKLLDDQERAKVALTHVEPFLGSMIGRIRFVYTFQVDTQATDGYNIFVNPQFTAELNFEQKVFVLAHELWHCILDHMRRGKQAGHPLEKSNIAADYEVNDTITLSGLIKDDIVKKTRGLLDHKYDNWSYEKIYADNPRGPQQSGNQSNSDEASEADKNNGDNQSGSNGQQQQQKRSPEYVTGWNQAMADYKAGKIKL